MQRKSDVAFGSEFSPVRVDLSEVLAMIAQHEGDRGELLVAVQRRWYSKAVVAKNLPLALRAYGIIEWGSGPDDKATKREKEKRYHLTDAGRRLLALKDNPTELHAEMARHILLEVPGGIQIVEIIEDLTSAGEEVKMARVRDELVTRGLHTPKNGMHATRIRLWLEKSGVITPAPHRVDQARKNAILGIATDELEALAGLSNEQKAFARALARMNVREARSNDVAKYATELFGVRFPDTGLPGAVLEALQNAGLLRYQKTTAGRGGKPGVVTPTERLRSEVFEKLLDAVERGAGLEYRGFVRKPFTEVLTELTSSDKNIKGKALEALAAKIGFHLSLGFLKWRLRGRVSGGAEVDLVFESARPVYLRWNMQCKNTASVRLDDVAKEVGLAVEMASNVVVVVSTGRFTLDAREHAKHVMARTNLTVVLMDGSDIKKIAGNPTVVVDMLASASEISRSVKRLEVEE